MTHRKEHKIGRIAAGAVVLGTALTLLFAHSAKAHGQDRPDLSKGKERPAVVDTRPVDQGKRVAKAEDGKVPLMIAQSAPLAGVLATGVVGTGPNPELEGLETYPLNNIHQLIQNSKQYTIEVKGEGPTFFASAKVTLDDGTTVLALVNVSENLLVVGMNGKILGAYNLDKLIRLNGGAIPKAFALFFDFDDPVHYDSKGGYRVGVNLMPINSATRDPTSGTVNMYVNGFTRPKSFTVEQYQLAR